MYNILSCTSDQLRNLYLDYTHITGALIPETITSLRILSLSGCYKLNSQSLCLLLNKIANTIMMLDISYTNITFRCSTIIHKLHQIESLILSECSLSDFGLSKILKSCGNNLKNLVLNKTNITFKHVVMCETKLQGLTNLEVSGCKNISSINIGVILSLTCATLKHLNISFTSVSVFDFEKSVNFNSLEKVWLNGCSKLTEHGVAGKICFVLIL